MPGISRSRYIRLMVISGMEIVGNVPLGIFYIVHNSKLGVTPWKGWAYTHKDYNVVYEIPASIWKNDPNAALALEMFRWSLVLCAFIFFALFGFANEARQNYRLLFTSIASRIGYSTPTLFRSTNAYVFCSFRVFGPDSMGLISFPFSFSGSSVPYVKNNGGVTVSVVTTSGDKRISSFSFSDQSLMESVFDDLKPGFQDKYSPSNAVMSSSVDSIHEPKSAANQDQSALPAGTPMPMVPSATVPPHLPGVTKSTFRAYSFDAV
jgi:hypothetical protein